MEQDQVGRCMTGEINGVESPVGKSIAVVANATDIRGSDVIVKYRGRCTGRCGALEYLKQLQCFASGASGVDIDCNVKRGRSEGGELRHRVRATLHTIVNLRGRCGAVHVVATDRAVAGEVVKTESRR